MKVFSWTLPLAAALGSLSVAAVLPAEPLKPFAEPSTQPLVADDLAASPAPVTGTLPVPVPAAIVQANPRLSVDPCLAKEVAANATRPAWDYAASTTQCGVIETDYGFLAQSIGAGVSQRMLVGSLRYGFTPKLDLRWGVANRIWQDGGAIAREGVGDQWLGARYRFHEQGKLTPAMAFLYAGKIPMANPAKGLGSGFADHQFLLIASRDLGKSHFDFNTAGTVIGESRGRDGAAQFGLALTRPLASRFSGILESYGGAQPGTGNRFGAGFLGVTYTWRPQLVLDCAYDRAYTAGSPRQQLLFGLTYARRSGFAPPPKSSAFARVLGR